MRERRVERLFEKIMAENIPKLRKDMNLEIQEVQWNLNGINPKFTHTETHFNLTFKRQRQREYLEGSEWIVTCHLKGNLPEDHQ